MVAAVTLLLLCVSHKANKMLFMLCGALLLGVSSFLIGPSHLFHLPDRIELMTAGMVVGGVGNSFLGSFITAYMIESASSAFREKEQEVKELVPPLICFTTGLEMLVFPLLTSAIYKATNFSTTLDLLGCFYLLITLLFLIHIFKTYRRKEAPARRREEEEAEEEVDQVKGEEKEEDEKPLLASVV